MKKYTKTAGHRPTSEAIRDGRCKQHMFMHREIKVGDTILWHGLLTAYEPSFEYEWELLVKVKKSIPIEIDFRRGMRIGGDHRNDVNAGWFGWETYVVREIAEKEFVDPPTGENLLSVMNTCYGEVRNGHDTRFQDYQMVMW